MYFLLRIRPWGKKGKLNVIYPYNSIYKICTELFCKRDRGKTESTVWHVLRFQWNHVPFLWWRLRHLWPSLHAKLVFARAGVSLWFYTVRWLQKGTEDSQTTQKYFFYLRKSFFIFVYQFSSPQISPHLEHSLS